MCRGLNDPCLQAILWGRVSRPGLDVRLPHYPNQRYIDADTVFQARTL
jgi:hypothetical protein